jgi:hypothetical protein
MTNLQTGLGVLVGFAMFCGCAMEVDQAEGFIVEGAVQPLVESWPLDFGRSSSDGMTPVPPRLTEVVSDGVVGWQDRAYSVATTKGSKTGRMVLKWSTDVLPEDGTYRLRATDAPFIARGRTTVKGRGNMFTGIDAKASVVMHVFLVVGDRQPAALYDGLTVARDETKSERRTKSFYKEYRLPDGYAFSGVAGEDVSLQVALESTVWSNNDGSASVDIERFCIPAVYSTIGRVEQ